LKAKEKLYILMGTFTPGISKKVSAQENQAKCFIMNFLSKPTWANGEETKGMVKVNSLFIWMTQVLKESG
jgi:hypothetical protein